MNDEHLNGEHLHASDEQLLLYADCESRTVMGDEIPAHLECCSQCRSRLATLEGALDEFAGAHRKTRDAELPPASDSHALLKARLAELAAQGLRPDELRSATCAPITGWPVARLRSWGLTDMARLRLAS